MITTYVTLILKDSWILSYFVICAWMLLTATFPISFFFYSEYFFIPAGLLAWMWILDIKLVYVATVIWVLLWDLISYSIWKRYKKSLFKENAKYMNIKNLKKWEEFFEKYWSLAIPVSKVIPAVPWISSFLAWAWNMKLIRFITYDFLSILAVFALIYWSLYAWITIVNINWLF